MSVATLIATCGWRAPYWTGLIESGQRSTPGGRALGRRRGAGRGGGLIGARGSPRRGVGFGCRECPCAFSPASAPRPDVVTPTWLCSSQHVPLFWGELPGGQHLGGPRHHCFLLLGPQGDPEVGLPPAA